MGEKKWIKRMRRDPDKGSRRNCSFRGEENPSHDENTDLPEFPPNRGHLLLKGVYVDYPHHNNWVHLGKESQTMLFGSIVGAMT